MDRVQYGTAVYRVQHSGVRKYFKVDFLKSYRARGADSMVRRHTSSKADLS